MILNIKSLRFAAVFILTVSCASTKTPVVKNPKNPVPTKSVDRKVGLKVLESEYRGSVSKEIEELLRDAEKYLGAPYKYAGNTSSGFDCSGFTCKVFNENQYQLPRRSSDQALTGEEIDIAKVKPGDLLFFATAGGSKVSHVGIVHDIGRDGEVKFIHASTSKGVIISSLNESYWNKAYLHAQRVFN